MKRFLLLLLLLSLSAVSYATSLPTFFTDADRFLRRWVRQGRVDYAGVKQNFDQIEGLYAQINQMSLTSAPVAEKKAFYINAYNLIVIYQVSRYYPLKSPMNQSGFFDKVKHTVAGEPMTLNFLEIKKIVFPYRDPRIHFALACAAISCPELASFAYFPQQLDQQLNRRTTKALNDAQFIRVKANTVAVSKLFDWYERDFTQDGQTVLGFINKYRTPSISDSHILVYYDYNWELNDQ